MDENPYKAPQTEPKRPIGKVPALNTGAIVGAVIGGLLVPVWSLVEMALTENRFGAPDAINLVFVSAVIALASAGIGALIQSLRSQ
jgi:hypothetical protein